MNFEKSLSLFIGKHNLSCDVDHISVTYQIKTISSVNKMVFYCICPVCCGEMRYVRD